MKKAYLVLSVVDEEDEYGSYVRTKMTLTRYTNPVINGKFTGHAWYSMPREIPLGKSPQDVANEYGEVIFYAEDGRYYYPEK